MKILLAEDSKRYRQLITDYLEKCEFDFVVAEDGLTAWKYLEDEAAPNVALLDWFLPGMSALELCQRIRTRTENQHYVYTIVLTTKSQRGAVLEAMDAGADDFLTKPFDPPELKARLMAGKRIVLLQRELIAVRDCLRFGAAHDSLTSLLNRAEIIAVLRLELARARREGTPVGIVLADLDHFKRINHTFGNSAGDSVLQETARRFRSGLRVYDGVGRYGGEEFLLVLPGCDLASSIGRSDAVRELISGEPIVIPQGSVTTTVSMGVVSADSTVDASVEMLLEKADKALYQAKRDGRNRVVSYDVVTGSFAASY